MARRIRHPASFGLKKVSYGLWKLSYGLAKVLDGLWNLAGGARYAQDIGQIWPRYAQDMPIIGQVLLLCFTCLKMFDEKQ